MQLYFIFLGFFLWVSSLAFALPPESTLDWGGGIFSYYVSHDLNLRNEGITAAVITVHGSERNAHNYYGSIDEVAQLTGRSANTLILAPHFKLATDSHLAREYTWTEESWLRGDPSEVGMGVSSFDLIDHFVSLLSNASLFPNLRSIIVSGHSSGGQLVQRYAIGTTVDQGLGRIHFRFLVMNPGSYAYLTDQRPFSLPNGSVCRNYNDYKYGLNNLNEYMGRFPLITLIEHYLHRDVVYFLGELDTAVGEIDQSCAARMQGSFRRERGEAFKIQLDLRFPENEHRIRIAPGISHTQHGLYVSDIGRELLFPDGL